MTRMRQSRTLDDALDDFIAAPDIQLVRESKLYKMCTSVEAVAELFTNASLTLPSVGNSVGHCGIRDNPLTEKCQSTFLSSLQQSSLSPKEMRQFVLCLFEIKLYAARSFDAGSI